MRDGGAELEALEGVGGLHRTSQGGSKGRREAVVVTGKRAVVHIPEEGGAACTVFGSTADEEESAIEAGTDPMLAVVDATPDVVGIIAEGGGDAEVVVRGRGSDWVLNGGGRTGHNRSGGQSQESQCFQQCIQFHGLIRLVLGWVEVGTLA